MSSIRQIRLSDKRQQWVGKRTTTLIGKPMNHDIQLENQYAKILMSMADKMSGEYTREVLRFLKMPQWKDNFTTDASIASQVNILFNHLDAKFRRLFKQKGKETAIKMINAVNKISRISTESSLKKLTGGLTISTDFITDRMRDQMKAFVYENKDLAIDIEEKYTYKVKVQVLEEISSPQPDGIKGMVERLEKTFEKDAGIVRRRAKNIAHDQIRQAYNNLNANRMIAIGQPKFKWVHSKGGLHPRLWHMNHLDGNVYDLTDPPVIDPVTGVKGIPGQLTGCKCFMVPVIEFDEGEPVGK